MSSNVMGLTPKQEHRFRAAPAPLSRNWRCVRCKGTQYEFTGRKARAKHLGGGFYCAECVGIRASQESAQKKIAGSMGG